MSIDETKHLIFWKLNSSSQAPVIYLSLKVFPDFTSWNIVPTKPQRTSMLLGAIDTSKPCHLPRKRSLSTRNGTCSFYSCDIVHNDHTTIRHVDCDPLEWSLFALPRS